MSYTVFRIMLKSIGDFQKIPVSDRSESMTIYKVFKDHTNLVILIVSAIIMLVMLIIYTANGNGADNDVVNFYKHAEAIKAGQIPYKDFVFEFPPFSLVFFMIPSMFTSDMHTYVVLYGVEIIFFSVLTLYFMIKVAEKMKVNKYLVSIIFMIFIVLYFDQMIRKFDIIVAAFTFISLYLFYEKKYTLSYAVLAFAALVKIYPVFLIPIFIIMNLADKEDTMRVKNVQKGIVACLCVAFVAAVPLFLLSVSVSDMLSFVGFHSVRGFQVESVVAVIVQNLASLGFTTATIVPSCDTYDIISPICSFLLPYWSAVSALAIILIWMLIIYHASKVNHRSSYRDSARDVMIYSLAVLMTFMLVNKVFSTQYVIWLYALLPFLVVINEKKINIPIAVLAILIVALSYQIGTLGPYYELFPVLNLIRDVMMFFILSQIILYLLDKRNILDLSCSEVIQNCELQETK